MPSRVLNALSVCLVVVAAGEAAAQSVQQPRPRPQAAAPAAPGKAEPSSPQVRQSAPPAASQVVPHAAAPAPALAPAPTPAPVPDAAPAPAPPAAVEPEPAAEPPASLPPPAAAEAPPPPPPVLPDLEDVLAPAAAVLSAIEGLEKLFDRSKSSDAELSQRLSDLLAVTAQIQSASEALQPRIDAVKVLLEKLGPAPQKGQPPEAPQIAAERNRLSAALSRLEGAFKSTELARLRARQLNGRIQEARHALFAQNLFQRTDSPLQPGIWRQIAAEYAGAARQLTAVFGTWRGIIVAKWHDAALAGGGAITAFAILWLIARRLMARTMPRSPERLPGFATRAAAASFAAPLYAVPGIAAILIVYLGFDAADLIYSRVEALAEDLAQSGLTFVVVTALASAILEPRKPTWRLMNLSDKASRSLWRSVRAIALVYCADLVAKETIRLLVLPLPFNMALSFVTSLAFAALLLQVVLTPFVPGAPATLASGDPAMDPPPGRVSRWSPWWLKLPLLAVAAAIVAASCAGYVALGRFAAGQVVITGSAAVVVALLHLGIRTAERAVVSEQSWLGQTLAAGLGLDDGQRTVVARALSGALHVILAMVAVPGLLLAWGFSLTDVLGGLNSAMFGFEIGHFRISLARILMAFGLFAGLLFATRLLQRWLQGSVLRSDRMDPGIANSIHQGAGYAGFGLATLAAVSFAGIDITNLAIVAGALSVGIGFGLQSIVNNFVSGLILLIERPIKVGDWIVVKGGGEGYVRAISVRSTEIETFDRASLIVPNSELISNVVTNWTHRNALGRIIVKVSASYKSDPDQVLRVLGEVARSSPLVMQQPPPLVTLDNLGPDGLEFSMRVLVTDINKALGVKTELRASVLHAFRRHGIEFPTAERDIYLRDLDGAKVFIARLLEERARSAAQQNAAQQNNVAKPADGREQPGTPEAT